MHYLTLLLFSFINTFYLSVAINLTTNLKSDPLPATERKKIKCQRCGRVWTYRGENPYFATCTFCKTTVSIRRSRVRSDSLMEVINSHEPESRDVNVE